MKKTILISVSLLIYYCSIAQPPAPGTNELNNYINKFEGTWQWTSGNDTVVLKIKKFNTQFSDYRQDVLLGTHKYVKNGLVLESSMDGFDSIGVKYRKSTILLSNHLGADTSVTEGSINDLTKKKVNNLRLTYIPGTTPTIIWHLETAEGTYIDPNFQYGLTMPRDIILTKQ